MNKKIEGFLKKCINLDDLEKHLGLLVWDIQLATIERVRPLISKLSKEEQSNIIKAIKKL